MNYDKKTDELIDDLVPIHRQEEFRQALIELVAKARVDELKLACEYWEKNPTKPATYLIDRTEALSSNKQGGGDELV